MLHPVFPELLFQSTLPREERQYPEAVRVLSSISIHAPTRGATISTVTLRTTSKFQSTLPREERRPPPAHADTMTNFNPRSHERSDGNT